MVDIGHSRLKRDRVAIGQSCCLVTIRPGAYPYPAWAATPKLTAKLAKRVPLAPGTAHTEIWSNLPFLSLLRSRPHQQQRLYDKFNRHHEA